jgi:glycosyltransferase involved in cell wall biosynthesis
MRLAASLIVRNELGRYLEPCVAHLLEFCDEVRVLDDYSDDGTCEWLCDHPRVGLLTNDGPSFAEHEGIARQRLLGWTVEARPDFVLAIDADEFVADGQALRAALEGAAERQVAFGLRMCEVWSADQNGLRFRVDGGWRPHSAPIVWRVPSKLGGQYRIQPRELSSGREPMAIRRLFGQARDPVTGILHFGWTNVAERQARYAGYMRRDGGKFHASAHLRSIMFPDARCRLNTMGWPDGLIAYRERILESTHG